ncbi:MAG: choice-of-anchor D domain-containing protein, partial [Candidatus Angelobacter sp.]
TGAAQSVTLTNTGNIPMTVSGITISGDFAQTNACGSTLAPGAACIVSVTFTPTTRFSRAGILSIQSNATPPSANVSLSGTGIAPVAALTASLSFAPQIVRTTTTQTAVLANNGDASLAIASIAITGDFAQSNTCPATLAPAASCSIQVSFTPTASGARSGSLTLSDNDPASPAQTTALSGTGLDYSLTASPGSVTVRAGSAALYTVTVTALGGTFLSPVNLSCSGLPTSATCTFSPAAISPGGGSSSSSLQITTSNGQHGLKKTPAGTYIITIGGASGSLSHTNSVTLIVQ